MVDQVEPKGGVRRRGDFIEANRWRGSVRTVWKLLRAGRAAGLLAGQPVSRIGTTHVGSFPSQRRAGTIWRHRPISFHPVGDFVQKAVVVVAQSQLISRIGETADEGSDDAGQPR